MTFHPVGQTIGNLTPPLTIANGGTGQTTQGAALTALLGSSTVPIANGGTGQATDPLPPFMASDTGLLAWNFDVTAATGSGALPTSGSINIIRVNLRTAISVTNVIYEISVVGNTLTTGQCFAGLYNSSGTLIGTSADQAAAWAATTGPYTTPLTGGPFAAGPGFVWVALLFNGTTGPAIGRASTLSTPMLNIGTTAATARFARTSAAGQTSLTTFTPSSNITIGSSYWVALS